MLSQTGQHPFCCYIYEFLYVCMKRCFKNIHHLGGIQETPAHPAPHPHQATAASRSSVKAAPAGGDRGRGLGNAIHGRGPALLRCRPGFDSQPHLLLDGPQQGNAALDLRRQRHGSVGRSLTTDAASMICFLSHSQQICLVKTNKIRIT